MRRCQRCDGRGAGWDGPCCDCAGTGLTVDQVLQHAAADPFLEALDIAELAENEAAIADLDDEEGECECRS